MDFEFVQHLHGIELIYPPNKLPNSLQSITMNLILQKQYTKKEASKGLNIKLYGKPTYWFSFSESTASHYY
jgi:hypothetical protein